MQDKVALVFGHNKYASEIREHVSHKYAKVRMFTEDIDDVHHKEREQFELFDLSDDWSSIGDSIDVAKSIAFCVLEDNAENIFLTISLRAYFQDLTIIAIASNKENADKLSMAGATRVIPVVETTADIIANILQLPISNKVLHSILFEENDLKIAQIKITKECTIKDEQIVDIDWTRYQGIIVLSLMHADMKSEFIYASKIKHHILKEGDMLVVVGYLNDIDEFKKFIGAN
jgi:Trk K+ transport system NAD-binding subunit